MAAMRLASFQLRTLSVGLALAVAPAIAWPVSADAPRYTDLSDTLPARHVYSGDWTFFVGGGVAVFDCNDDGYPDLYAAGGDGPARLFINETMGPGETLQFSVATDTSPGLGDVLGAYPLDIDGDAVLDIVVLRAGPNVVLQGKGDCAFEPALETWGIDPGDHWTTAFSAAWGPGDAWPTLAIGNYVDQNDPEGPFGTCDDHQLLRPGGSGYATPEPIAPGHCTLSMLFTDWQGSGRMDLWISNDRHYYVRDGQEQLFRVWPQLQAYGEDDGWTRSMLWGMGIASRDITGDGKPEIAVTSMADQKLFQLQGDGAQPSFASIAYPRGTTAHVPYMGDEGRPSTGWHVAFGDVQNDGLDDLFIAKGNVNQMPDAATRDPDNLLIQNPDGTFRETGDIAGVGSTQRSRGAALVDLNRDGLLDLVVVQRRAPLRLFQNASQGAGNWLKLRLTQPQGNRFAVGARIELEADSRRQFREIQVGGGHAGGHAGYAHFGLGDADTARLRVRWPDGTIGPWHVVDANRHLTYAVQTAPRQDAVPGDAAAPPATRQ